MPIAAILDHHRHKSKTSESTASIVSSGGLSIAPRTSLEATYQDDTDNRGHNGAEQLVALNNQLRVENRVREGAENMLKVDLPESLRAQLLSELDMAQNKINTINRKIEAHNTTRKATNTSPELVRRKFNGAPLQNLPKPPKDEVEESEDFQSVFHQATSYIKTLNNLAHPGVVSPPHSPSSSTMPTQPHAAELNRPRIEAMNGLLGVLQRNLRVRYEISIPDVMQSIVPALSDRASKHCRATAYRLIRHMMVDRQAVESIRQQPLDWYIVKSLARDNKHVVEKEQVIKLIRAIVEVGSQRRSPGTPGSGSVPLSEPVMRAFIAVAEHPEDPFKLICMQTLTEILLIDVELMAKSGGIRVLLHALAEGPLEMAPLLSAAFLHLVDSPRTRSYLEPGVDLEMAMAGITDAYGKGSEHAERMRGIAKIVTSMLRTWSGLMYFCIHDKLALRALVDGLRIPSLKTREVILDMFFELFNIKPPEWHQAFIDGRRLTMYRRNRPVPEPAEPSEPPRSQEASKIPDQYIALLLLVFSEAGLIDALMSMLEEVNEEGESQAGPTNLLRKATLLIAEILQTANRVLPLSMAAKIQALPQIFDLASNYASKDKRIVGALTLQAIDSYNRHRARLQPVAVKDSMDTRPRANSVEDALRRGQKQVEQTRLKMGLQMDDKALQALILESQVMVTKDHTKWNFEVLQELLEGPLLNAKRMEEAVKASRYIKKLMTFFHPFNHRFSDMIKTKTNVRWIRIGCLLLNALLACGEGIKFLGEDDFLNQIVKSFAQLDPFNGTPNQDPIFSKRRMQETLTHGYFEMLGILSKRKEGLELLEKAKLFTAFYHLSELRSREDLIKAMIENLDYSFDGHARIVLSKALTSSYREIRLYATNHVGELIRGSAQPNTWTLRLLLTQLYDPDPSVQAAAARFLEEACENPDVLQIVVEMRPTLDHLGDVGHSLLLKFMSTSMGFRYLYAAEYIDREMDTWFHERNLHYVVSIEVFLSKAFGFVPNDDDDPAFDGAVPPHFYGVMAKTDLGCQILQEKGHFSEFVQFITKHGLESDDQDIIMKLKSVLWAVGNIGATERGLPFLEEGEIIPSIIEIAEQSAVLSVRGTCFFVLGLISSTPQGAEVLDDYHWEATLSPLGLPTGLCVPVDVDRFVSIPPWQPRASCDKGLERIEPPKGEEEIEVMTAIYNLANTVIANTASRTLAKMKNRSKYRYLFSSTTMLYRALHVISSQRYRLPVRRYVLDLFNVELDAEVVEKLDAHAQRLRIKPFPRTSEGETVRTRMARGMSIVARPPKKKGMSDSEDSSEDDTMMKKHPVMKLRPISRIVDFNDEDST